MHLLCIHECIWPGWILWKSMSWTVLCPWKHFYRTSGNRTALRFSSWFIWKFLMEKKWNWKKWAGLPNGPLLSDDFICCKIKALLSVSCNLSLIYVPPPPFFDSFLNLHCLSREQYQHCQDVGSGRDVWCSPPPWHILSCHSFSVCHPLCCSPVWIQYNVCKGQR